MSDEQNDMREQFSAYLDGMLEDEERARLEAWLDADPSARAELDALRRVDARFRALPRVSAPDDFEERLRERLATPRVRFRRGARPSGARLWPLLAAAAVLLMFAGVLVPALLPKPDAEMQIARELPKAEPAHGPAAHEQIFYLEAAPAREPVPIPELEAETEPAPTLDLDASRSTAASRALTRDSVRPSPAAPPAPALAPPAPKAEPAEIRDGAAADIEALGYLASPPAPAPILLDDAEPGNGIAPTLPAPASQALPTVSEPPDRSAGHDIPVQPEARSRRQLGSGRAGGGLGGFVEMFGESPRHEERRVAGRLFRLRDGVWVQRGYGGQPLTRLERGSTALNAVAESHPDVLDVVTLEPRAVFRAGGVWYSVVPPGSARLESLGYLE